MEFPFNGSVFGSGESKPLHSYRKKLVRQIRDLDLSSMMTSDIDGNPENIVGTDTNLALNLTIFNNPRQ